MALSTRDPRYQFLSTPSARRATSLLKQNQILIIYFYPRPPRGGRQRLGEPMPQTRTFLSTPSARRATMRCVCGILGVQRFLSTPSARRATPEQTARETGQTISIHALREEGDEGAPPLAHGAQTFLSAPSARRATDLLDRWNVSIEISIHALREEGDPDTRQATAYDIISIHALREEGDACC